MNDDVIELGVHVPSVESVISRLERFQDKIKHITVVVEWKDDSADVFHDTKDIKNICYELMILGEYAKTLIVNTKEDGCF